MPTRSRRAIIIGASWGLGKGLAERLSQGGYELGLIARKRELLLELRAQLPGRALVKQSDIRRAEEAIRDLKTLIRELGGLDLLILNASVGYPPEDLNWQSQRDIIDTNVLGITAMASTGMRHFLNVGRGHLVGISSINALKAHALGPTFAASKAFLSRFLQGLRHRAGRSGLPITITDIKPGFIDTAPGRTAGTSWRASVEKAACQICRVIEKKKPHAYVTKRWRLIGWMLKILPDRIYCRKSGIARRR